MAGEMVGLEEYPNFRLQENNGDWSVWERGAAMTPGLGYHAGIHPIVAAWAELPGRYATRDEAEAAVRAIIAERQMGPAGAEG